MYVLEGEGLLSLGHFRTFASNVTRLRAGDVVFEIAHFGSRYHSQPRLLFQLGGNFEGAKSPTTDPLVLYRPGVVYPPFVLPEL